MEKIVYQLFLVLCRPNELNFTQLIAVTFTTVTPRRQDFGAGEPQIIRKNIF